MPPSPPRFAARRARAAPSPPPSVAASAEASEARDAARVARAAAAELNLSRRERLEASRPVPGLAASEPMGRGYVTEEALRSGLPSISFRVPGTDTQVRLYGFTKVTTWHDLNTRNQTDAAFAASLPLRGSQADRQGGDFGITARYSRFGVDTQSLTNWGTLETRIEGDSPAARPRPPMRRSGCAKPSRS